MQADGISPDRVTFNTVLSACRNGGQFERAIDIFESLPKLGICPNRVTCNTMITVYSRIGHFEKVTALFEEMLAAPGGSQQRPDLLTYNSVLQVRLDYWFFCGYRSLTRTSPFVRHVLFERVHRDDSFAAQSIYVRTYMLNRVLVSGKQGGNCTTLLCRTNHSHPKLLAVSPPGHAWGYRMGFVPLTILLPLTVLLAKQALTTP